MASKKEPKTLTLHDYLVKYEVGIGILITIGLAIWSKSADKTNSDLESGIKIAKMEIRISNNTDRIISLERVLYHN